MKVATASSTSGIEGYSQVDSRPRMLLTIQDDLRGHGMMGCVGNRRQLQTRQASLQ